MADTIDRQQLMQAVSAMPVCRVHVYSSTGVANMAADYRTAAMLPLHWCGVNAPDPGALPFAVLGREAIQYFDQRDGKKLPRAMPIQWEILEARVNRTRHWNCSSASFQIAHPIWNENDLHVPPVMPNDVIVIEMGYTVGPYSRVSYREGEEGQPGGRTNYKRFTGDVVFYGIVDTITERGGSGDTDGVVWTIKARDAMSILADNKIRGNFKGLEGTGSVGTISNRAYAIRDIIWAGSRIDYVVWQDTARIDGIKNPNSRGPLPVSLDETGKALRFRQAYRENKDSGLADAPAGPRNTYLRIGNIQKSTRSDNLEQGNPGISAMDKFPLQLLKHMCLLEEAPRELWADHRTGAIQCLTRFTDARRLKPSTGDNPQQQAKRQYFYRFPADRANILSYTNEWSTAGTVTHFILSNPNPQSNNTADLYAESPYALLKDPHSERYLRPMTRNRFAYDDTLGKDNNAATSEAVAGALFSVWGRTLESGTVMVLGDPTLEIGEAVQLFNTGLFGRRAADPKIPQLFEGGTYDGVYADIATNPEGIQRVEAVSHLFGVGGVKRGYVTVFVFGPVDPDTGGPTKRFITSNDDLQAIIKNCIPLYEGLPRATR
jgi:hypothetical protein